MTKKNKYLDILNKYTDDRKCKELNQIVLKIADYLCELLKQQYKNTQQVKPSGAITMQISKSCPNNIPDAFQSLGTYDNTDLYYDEQKNEFCMKKLQ